MYIWNHLKSGLTQSTSIKALHCEMDTAAPPRRHPCHNKLPFLCRCTYRSLTTLLWSLFRIYGPAWYFCYTVKTREGCGGIMCHYCRSRNYSHIHLCSLLYYGTKHGKGFVWIMNRELTIARFTRCNITLKRIPYKFDCKPRVTQTFTLRTLYWIGCHTRYFKLTVSFISMVHQLFKSWTHIERY